MMISFSILTLATIVAAGKYSDDNFNLRTAKNNQFSREAVVNGEAVLRDTYPWFVSGSEGCGGCLISSQFIVTTAYCVSYFERVAVGSLCHQKPNCGQTRERFNIEEVFVHPLYDAISLSNDIALIKLDGVSEIEPVGVDLEGISNNYTEDKDLWIAGFGDYDNHLMQAKLKFVPDSECSLSFDEGEIDHSMMCAMADYEGPCNGDSGGPLYDGENNMIVGLISWGSKPCANKDKPSVYNRLAVERDFIKDIVCNHSNGSLPPFCIDPDTIAPTATPTMKSTSTASTALQR